MPCWFESKSLIITDSSIFVWVHVTCVSTARPNTCPQPKSSSESDDIHLTCPPGNEYDLQIEMGGMEVQRGQVCKGREQLEQELPMLKARARETDFVGCFYCASRCPVDAYQNKDDSLQILWPHIDNAAGQDTDLMTRWSQEGAKRNTILIPLQQTKTRRRIWWSRLYSFKV